MEYIDVLRNSKRAAFAFVATLALILPVVFGKAVYAQAGTGVSAVICNSGATITLAQPVSDSIVTDPNITISGQSTQASQVEIYVNDQLDGITSIPLGQSTFSATTTLSNGTSTIKVVAIDVCQMQNGEASSVVTFNPPPNSSGSNGGNAQTNLPGQGVVIGGDYEVSTKASDKDIPFLELVPPIVARSFETVGNWLNITTAFEGSDAPQLTALRATTIAIGSWLLAFGVATSIIQWAASSVSFFNKIPKARRTIVISRGVRIFGLIILLAGIFL